MLGVNLYGGGYEHQHEEHGVSYRSYCVSHDIPLSVKNCICQNSHRSSEMSSLTCGLGIASPNTWTLTQAVCEKKIVGTVTGIQNFGGNLGGIIAPALTGFIAHVTNSFALALIVTGAILVAGALAYWFLITARVELKCEGFA